MKQVMLFARDPGGANVLMPVYRKMRGRALVSVYGKEFALASFLRNGIPAKELHGEVFSFLKEQRPDFLLTGTSLNDNTERYLWKAARELGIKSAAILDQWMNPGIRFSAYSYEDMEAYQKSREHPYMPNQILVMDSLAAGLLEQEGIGAEKITITGQPHFDTILERYKEAPERKESLAYRICYVSEPLQDNYDKGKEEAYWGYNEKTNFFALSRCLKELSKELSRQLDVVIRPHPRESLDYWKNLVENWHEDGIGLRLDEKSDSFALLKEMDLICGMSSMFLLEATICGKPVVSIQLGLKRKDPFVLSTLGCCKTQLTEEQLKNTLRTALTEGRQPFRFDFIKSATEKVISYIEKEMECNG